MKNHSVQNVLLVTIIALFISGANSYAWDGPCWDNNVLCGAYWAGPETCPQTYPWCGGTCRVWCPQGGLIEYCAGLLFGCTERNAPCGQVLQRKCFTAGIMQDHCACDWFGFAGYTCDRIICS